METLQKVQRTIKEDDYLTTWLEQFLHDRKAQSLSPNTISFYKVKLSMFSRFCDTQLIKNISQISSQTIESYLLWLEQEGHNKGGIHCYYRTVKTFLIWYWDEVEPETRNPIERVKAPRLEIEPIKGVSLKPFKSY